jgi:Tfp pilus assembly protein PilP
MTSSAQRLAWLCAELAAGNSFSLDDLRRWERQAREEAAAALDMLVALKEAHGAVYLHRQNIPGWPVLLSTMLAAIAKAEGRADG